MQHASQRGRRARRLEADHVLDEDVLWLSLRIGSHGFVVVPVTMLLAVVKAG
jgi:hypothetical protein